MSNSYIPRAEVIGGAGVAQNVGIYNALTSEVQPLGQASTVIVSGLLPSAGNLNMTLSAPVVAAAFLVGAVLANTPFRFKLRLPKGAVCDLQSSVAQASVPLLAVDESRGPVG